MFANGEHPYSSYIELVRADGSWISRAARVCAVLPDGRLLMVVEQRPPQGRFDQAKAFIMNGETVDLTQFGPYSSLEFPGGAVDPEDNRSFKAAFLRELHEETGSRPEGTLYLARHMVHTLGSDVAIGEYYGVIYLTGVHFESHVASDGGLHVFALRPEDVERNIYQGNIRSGQAGLLSWFFYQEVERMRRYDAVNKDFLTVETVRLTS